ncbi:uncharacterized protein J3R85_017946 [Psidium guajava]|nr:uncharacterized protein J3R85_017946 [Psidium guajava]
MVTARARTAAGEVTEALWGGGGCFLKIGEEKLGSCEEWINCGGKGKLCYRVKKCLQFRIQFAQFMIFLWKSPSRRSRSTQEEEALQVTFEDSQLEGQADRMTK